MPTKGGTGTGNERVKGERRKKKKLEGEKALPGVRHATKNRPVVSHKKACWLGQAAYRSVRVSSPVAVAVVLGSPYRCRRAGESRPDPDSLRFSQGRADSP